MNLHSRRNLHTTKEHRRTNQLNEKDLLEKILLKYEKDTKNVDYGVLLDAVISANQNISMGVL
jgi:hypothetical protein